MSSKSFFGQNLVSESGGLAEVVTVLPEESKAGDICLYDKTAKELIIVPQDQFYPKAYPKSKYSPVGVVVVPGTHDVYQDGSCAIMAYVNMSCDTPETGNASKDTNAKYSDDWNLSSIKAYTTMNSLKNNDPSNPISLVENYNYNNSFRQLSIFNDYEDIRDEADWYPQTRCGHDDSLYVYYTGVGVFFPSPYLSDDVINITFSSTDTTSVNNAFSNFDGYGDTQKHLAVFASDTSWKTGSLKTGFANYMPPIAVCQRYYTEGTKAGDWYLPSIAELIYVPSRAPRINNGMTLIRNTFGVDTVKITMNDWGGSWSSTVSSNADSSSNTHYIMFPNSSCTYVLCQYESFGGGMNCTAFYRVRPKTIKTQFTPVIPKFQYSLRDSDYQYVTWNAVSNAEGYEVHYYDESSKQYKTVFTTATTFKWTNNSYPGGAVGPDTEAALIVRSIPKDKNKYLPSTWTLAMNSGGVPSPS